MAANAINSERLSEISIGMKKSRTAVGEVFRETRSRARIQELLNKKVENEILHLY